MPFTFDEFDKKWCCDNCNARIKREQEPTFCQNCEPMLEPQYADRWRITGRGVKLGEKYDKRGRLEHEVYVTVGYDRPCDANGWTTPLSLSLVEAKDGSMGGMDLGRLDRDKCAELAVMFWKLSENLPLDNLVNKEVK